MVAARNHFTRRGCFAHETGVDASRKLTPVSLAHRVRSVKQECLRVIYPAAPWPQLAVAAVPDPLPHGVLSPANRFQVADQRVCHT